MAKGNNGNLLQHCIETELAERLRSSTNESVFVAFTHAMNPFEAFEKRKKSPNAYRLLECWLEEARFTNRPLEHRPAVVRAYRATKASGVSYPNSAELVAAILGREHLTGHVFETQPQKVAALRQAWAGTRLQVHGISWRRILEHLRPGEIPSPWLMSLDPNTYRLKTLTDDDFALSRADLRLVAELTAVPLLKAAHRGALTIFCYGMRAAERAAFIDDVTDIFKETVPRSTPTFIETVARGGNTHVCALITSEPELTRKAVAAWGQLQLLK